VHNEILLKKIVSLINIPALLIILLVVQGIIFSGMFPMWEPWDEFAHFAYIQYLVEEKALPMHNYYYLKIQIWYYKQTHTKESPM